MEESEDECVQAFLARIGTADFNPDKYVKELARSCVGGQELQKRRKAIRALGEEAAESLKRNVYENYVQFIETAEEISHLEAEMYQLSHLLTEQRTLLDTLARASILGDDGVRGDKGDKDLAPPDSLDDDRRKQRLNSIFEKVESCPDLADVPDLEPLHEGDLLELNADDDSPVQRMRAFLLSDRLMLASWIPNRRGPVRYRFQAAYAVGDMAVVNVRDLGNVKRAFKLLAFPDARVFQCNSAVAKKDWLDRFDAAKRAHLAGLAAAEQKRPEPADSPASREGSPTVETPAPPVPPDWLLDVGEELDVLIVERHFEKAFELARRAEARLAAEPRLAPSPVAEISAKIAAKRRLLRDVLLRELEITPEWTPRGGLGAVRNPVRLLVEMKMSAQAGERFLAICGRTVEAHVKGVQLEGSTVTYVRQVGEVFFCTMTDVISEFTEAFPPEATSSLIVWASNELRILMNQLVKQIFTPQASLGSIAQCVESLREQCALLKEFGLDLCFRLDGSLRNCIIKSLKDYKERTLDSMKGKVVEDKWTPVNLNTKVGVNEFLQEMQELGLILAKYVINETWIDLSSSTIWFTKSVLTLQCQGLRMVSEDMMEALDDCIYGIFNGRLMLSIGNDSSYAQKNFKFILDTLLPVMLKKYFEETGYENEKLVTLAQKYGISAPKKVTSNVTKYESDYL